VPDEDDVVVCAGPRVDQVSPGRGPFVLDYPARRELRQLPRRIAIQGLRPDVRQAAGRTLTRGGNESWARDINASGEVVGVSTSATGTNTGFYWSLSRGMLQLPANRWGAANAMSDVRSDGSRLVVGTDSQASAVVWVVRAP